MVHSAVTSTLARTPRRTSAAYHLVSVERGGVQHLQRRNLSDADRQRTGLDKLNAVRSDIPAVTHVDYSARVQTVHENTNPRLHCLIGAFKSLTGCSVLVNTSFNVRDEPIVCSPEDAYKCFMATEMDVLVLGNYVLAKEQQ